MSLVRAKVDQAIAILRELDLDVWLTFVRETTEQGDPVLPLIVGESLTWQSALLVAASGETIAIVGTHDAELVESTGAWGEVIGYVEGVGEPLRRALDRLAPRSIAINESVDDVKADGLTVGMHRLLLKALEGTPHAGRLTSAAELIRRVRGRKSAEEVRRIRAAIAGAESIFADVHANVRIGDTEASVAERMQRAAAARGWGLAWNRNGCPIVTTGPDSMGGHGRPSQTLAVRPGAIFHLDFGVVVDEYCSDLQRSWYVLGSGEREAPADARRAFRAVRDAIEAAERTLRPGVACHLVDAAARSTLVAAGYPEYDHATGHEVGRAAHDGGGVLGPRWDRYGRTPLYEVEVGNVFTLELGVMLPQRGYLGLEEMVVVTPNGCERLSKPQTELMLLGSPSAEKSKLTQ